MTPAPRLHEAAERLALVLSGQGLQRMTARVLTALLFSEKSSVTMSELADELQASAGAISGALKNLTSVGLVEMRDFYAFLLAEIPAVLERWHASRR